MTKPQKIKTLIVAAYGPELKHLALLGKKHFIIRDKVAYLQAGIGPVAATFGLTHFLEDYRPEKIIAIGTAGIIKKDKFKIGDVVCAKSVTFASGLDDAYACGEKFITLGTSSRNKKIKPAKVYVPQEISHWEARRKLLEKAGHEVEHLESFAYAFVAKKFKIPIQIILGLANFVGPNAHQQWQENESEVMKKVSRLKLFLKLF